MYTSFDLIRVDLFNGVISCSELVEYYLGNIKKYEYLNALTETFEEEALKRAKSVDQKIESGQAGKLAGMVLTIKDVFCYKDHRLQCSSHILRNFESQFNATVVERILNEDAIIIGRTNCDEFAMGSSNENSAFGPVKNGFDSERVPGGSSGGAAVSVQMDMCHVAIGSDTGGSVRQPAAFCGVIGLKPTYSRISRHGLTAYASSFDTVGVISKSIDSVAKVMEIIAGADEFDSTVSREEIPSYSLLKKDKHQYNFAYIQETLENRGLSPDIRVSFERNIQRLKNEGHNVVPVEFPLLENILPTYYILTWAEASSNLSRYDGVKYGHRSEDVHNIHSLYKKSRSEGFGEEVKRRIMLGTFVLSASYYDAYYSKAQKVRKLIRDQTKHILRSFDFILTPTTPSSAFKLGEHISDPLKMYLADLYTVQASVAGVPAISLPVGTCSKGLPIGIQVIANDFEEHKLLEFSNYFLNLDK
ncbi:MAG: Asp-tRNA(Asn)/Glu-tRNA(Gln) amidotransferase subunit GatA [Bacteroidota bacterium]